MGSPQTTSLFAEWGLARETRLEFGLCSVMVCGSLVPRLGYEAGYVGVNCMSRDEMFDTLVGKNQH